MSQITLVRLFIQICDAFEFWLIPQSVRWASALYQGVRKLLEKFRFRPIFEWPLLDWLRALRSRLSSAAARCPVWLCRAWPRVWSLILDAILIVGGSAVMVSIWALIWT